MTPATTFRGLRIALFGLGGSGLATALSLTAGGADVVAWDDAPASVERARAAGVFVEPLLDQDWSSFNALVLAPGVPLTHPEPHWAVRLANAHGVEIIGDIEIFCRERARHAPAAPFIAITGTNGKSTTTALIAHLLTAAGRDVAMGGNIGTAILSLPPPAAERIHVIEMSSFQIDLTPSLHPSVGVLTNISPDHIDRHGTLERYAAIKERLIRAADLAVIGVDDAWATAVASRREADGAPVVRISSTRALAQGIYDDRQSLYLADGGQRSLLASRKGLGSLRGAHNGQNAAAAIAAVRPFLPDLSGPQSALSSYGSLPHRMEDVGRVGGVVFINDSKATNAASTYGALSSPGLFWIVGGKAKAGGIDDLAPLFPNVVRAFLIGEASDRFAASLDGRVAYDRCVTLDVAVERAFAAARDSGLDEAVVLLSPACASYDQFRSFEHRGDMFRALVSALPGFQSAKGGA
jgi:UDP-N-acetylmuramoylalanine--D-glutamate ligase